MRIGLSLVRPKSILPTMILVEQPTVPDSYVKPVGKLKIESSLAIMKEPILSPYAFASA